MELSLTELANRHGTDKGTVGPSPHWKGNNYTDVYAAYLESMRNARLQLLEIGLGVTGSRWDARIVQGRNTGGASLKMWYDYFPRAEIVGIDVNPASYLDNDRIATHIADQGDADALRGVCDGHAFDLVVDDGSHRPDHQQISLGTIWPYLKSGGLYIIEDLTNNGLGDEGGGRHHSDRVLNTRAVLGEFTKRRSFREPHLISDPDAVSTSIASLSFHCPRVHSSVGLQRPWSAGRLRTPISVSNEFRTGTEKVCVIRKK